MKICKHPTCSDHCRRVKVPKKTKCVIKRTPIKKVSKKQVVKNKEKGKITKKDHALYQEIWGERDHIDFETGQPIFGESLTLYFHHVLPKKEGPGGYPQFRHKKWNIIIVSWETHTKAENNIDLVPKIKQYRDYLIKTYVK